MDCSALVVGLLAHGNPLAVIWRVVPVHILTLDGQAVLVSVAQCPIAERFIALPLFANPNPAPTVVVVELELRVVAPLEHSVVYMVELRLALAVSSVLLLLFMVEAPAASRAPTSQ